jgi:hypothetical protein
MKKPVCLADGGEASPRDYPNRSFRSAHRLGSRGFLLKHVLNRGTPCLYLEEITKIQCANLVLPRRSYLSIWGHFL